MCDSPIPAGLCPGVRSSALQVFVLVVLDCPLPRASASRTKDPQILGEELRSFHLFFFSRVHLRLGEGYACGGGRRFGSWNELGKTQNENREWDDDAARIVNRSEKRIVIRPLDAWTTSTCFQRLRGTFISLTRTQWDWREIQKEGVTILNFFWKCSVIRDFSFRFSGCLKISFGKVFCLRKKPTCRNRLLPLSAWSKVGALRGVGDETTS